MWAPPRIFSAGLRTALLVAALLLAGPACRREPAPAAAPPPASEPTPATPAPTGAPAATPEPGGGTGSDTGGDQRIGPEHLRYWTM